MAKANDLTLKRYSRFLVLTRVANLPGRSNARWLCLCQCGRAKIVVGSNLVRGRSRSCGCLQRDTVTKHSGEKVSGTPEYRAWQAMKSRRYTREGLVVPVCDEWRTSFEAFLKDVGRKPGADYVLGRIDPKRGYEPGAVFWVRRSDQIRNRRNTIWLTLDGEKIPLATAAKQHGVPYALAYHRYYLGWRHRDIISTPAAQTPRK